MKKYHPLQIFKYENNNNDVRVEYSNRVEGPTTIVSNLYINPEISGQRQGEKYPLFLMPIKDVLKLESTIHENSKIIENLTNELPGIASDQFFYKTLTEEIMSTNEIEGVETLNKEIIEAINGAENRSKKKIRLKSFARMYLGIRDRENIQINMLEDIRKIYDYLLDGEVAKSELPDGILFRNKFARVGTPDETVHQPKNTEQEISLDLKDWISFINNDDTPAILKCFIAHYYFENIHPFNDGNGRTGRYIACVYLGYKLDPLSAITFSSEVNKNKEKYYKAFKDVSNPNNFGEVTFLF
ncbi:Fic family protein (fragment) [Latilactobacillus sakei]|uniref:Fic family protein n=1 Tax=Latilactobacillus sakei TaxID=1599 RepID=UPI000C6F3C42